MEIETNSELTKGKTATDWNAAEPNAMICLDVDADALTAMFTERLWGPRQRCCLVRGGA